MKSVGQPRPLRSAGFRLISREQVAEVPEFVAPLLPTLVDRAPTGKEWLHEIKFDGYRTALRVDGGSPRMLTRSGVDWTAGFKPIAAAANRAR
jgi:bifunctional non-homologous end joining protein LigD